MARWLLLVALLSLTVACGAAPIHRLAMPIATPVPWAALPPMAPPEMPQPTPTPVPPGTRVCRASDLVGQFGYPNGGGGINYRTLSLANGSVSACQLAGMPQMTLWDSKGQQLSEPPGPNVPGPDTGPVLLSPGMSIPAQVGSVPGIAYVTLQWRRDDLGTCPRSTEVSRLTLSWTGSNGPLTMSTAGDTGISLSTCTGLSWSAFYSAELPAPLPTPRFTLMSATIEEPAQHGDRIDFDVRLYNGDSRPLDLAAPQCPNYSATLEAGGALAAKGVYQLNCFGIVVPAHGAVRFEMRLQLARLAKGPSTLLWILEDAGFPSTVVRAETSVVLA